MKVIRILCLIGVFTALAGCLTMKVGSPPEVDRLQSLRPGESKTADVLLLLGEPRGHGRAHLSAYPEAMKIWYYEYTEAGWSTIHLKILWVVFNGETYTGHIWFASNELLS